MKGKSEKSQKIHVVASVSGVILALAAYAFFTNATNALPTEDANNYRDLWSLMLLGVLLACSAYSVFVVFKTAGWLRLVSALCIVANLLLFAIIAFFYIFGKMFSSSH